MQYYLMGTSDSCGCFEFHGYCDQKDVDIILSRHPEHKIFYVQLEKAVTIYKKFINFTENNYVEIRRLFERYIKYYSHNIIYYPSTVDYKCRLMIELTNKIYYFHKFLEISKKV